MSGDTPPTITDTNDLPLPAKIADMAERLARRAMAGELAWQDAVTALLQAIVLVQTRGPEQPHPHSPG